MRRSSRRWAATRFSRRFGNFHDVSVYQPHARLGYGGLPMELARGMLVDRPYACHNVKNKLKSNQVIDLQLLVV